MTGISLLWDSFLIQYLQCDTFWNVGKTIIKPHGAWGKYQKSNVCLGYKWFYGKLSVCIKVDFLTLKICLSSVRTEKSKLARENFPHCRQVSFPPAYSFLKFVSAKVTSKNITTTSVGGAYTYYSSCIATSFGGTTASCISTLEYYPQRN